MRLISLRMLSKFITFDALLALTALFIVFPFLLGDFAAPLAAPRLELLFLILPAVSLGAMLLFFLYAGGQD